MLAVGLMCGTSLDGIDAALVSLRPQGAGYAIELVRFATDPFATAELSASAHVELMDDIMRHQRAGELHILR